MEQLLLDLPEDDKTRLKYLVKRSIVKIKKQYPKPVDDETVEEYRIFLRDEILLEIAQQLTELALHKQKADIDYLYKDINARE